MELNRKQFLFKLSTTLGVLTLFPFRTFSVGFSEKLRFVISKAGNSNSGKEQTKILKTALDSNDYSGAEKELLRSLWSVADHWANAKENYANPGSEGNESKGYLCSFFNYKCKIDRFLLPQPGENHPAYPLIAFYRSRMLVAQLIQNGGISGNPKVRKIYVDEGKRLMEIAALAFPKNELAKVYTGEFEPWEELVEYESGAPEWANVQRMLLAKLRYIIHWWIDNRQISDGQFGGGWGDDVEMWRKWVPVLFAFEDEKAIKSKEKLFEGLYGLSRMQKGYTTFLNDVEHTSEEYSDPLTCMLTMQPENPVWEERALKVLDIVEHKWTGTNKRGSLQFKSTWFNVDKVDLDEKRACDSPYHTRLMQPLLLIWLRTGNERVGKIIKAWLKTWVDATMLEEAGKPKGIIPAAIHWPDGKPAGTGENWWQPENYHTTLYDFPSQQDSMYECFLQAYHITKDEFYLQPIRYVAALRLEGIGNGNQGGFQPGSLEWSLAKLKGIIPQVLVKYKLFTDDTSYDEILKNEADGYEKFLFNGNVKELSQALAENRKSLSLPKEIYTSEVRWTDRLFAFSGKYFNDISQNKIPNFNPGLLFSSLTGSVGNYRILPVFGVKWLTPPNDIAVLTKTNTTTKFEAELYHFGTQARKMGVVFYNLENGPYEMKMNKAKKIDFQVRENNRQIHFEIPSQKLMKLELIKK